MRPNLPIRDPVLVVHCCIPLEAASKRGGTSQRQPGAAASCCRVECDPEQITGLCSSHRPQPALPAARQPTGPAVHGLPGRLGRLKVRSSWVAGHLMPPPAQQPPVPSTAANDCAPCRAAA